MVFTVGNGVYAAQFVAALASQLMVDPDIPRAIEIARGQVDLRRARQPDSPTMDR